MKITKLITIEYFKLRKQLFFWLISGFILLFFLMSAIKIGSMDFTLDLFFPGSKDINSSKFFMFPYVWQTFSWIAGWINHLWAFFIIVFITNEFNYKTARLQIITGLPRKEFLFSKFLTILLIPLVIVLLIIVLGLVHGFKYTENVSFGLVVSHSIYIFSYYLQALAYMTIALLISMLVESTGASIVVYIGYLFVEAIVRFALKISGAVGISYFLPAKNFSLLTPRPPVTVALSQNAIQQMPINDITSPVPLLLTIAVSMTYIALFLFLAWQILKKKKL